MIELLKQLNNRETATLIWIAAFLLWMLAMPKIRSAMVGVVKAFCQPAILKVVAAASIYIGASVWLIHWRGIWTSDFIYSTIVWAVSFAFVAMFEADKMSSNKRHTSKVIRDVVSVTGALIFIIELHSFSLPVELVALPILTCIAVLHEVSKMKEEHAPVEKLLGTILSLVGLSYLALSVWRTWTGFADINSIDTVRAFIIPILLSLLFLPFLYGLGVFMAYERIFGSLSIWMEGPLLKFARRCALLQCRTNLDYLQRWHRAVQRERPETREALRKSFKDLRIVLKREKSPPAVRPDEGWLPWTAKDFMMVFELETQDYHEGYEEKWYAETNLKALGAGFPRNNIGYYVEGEAACAKHLKLRLNVNDPANDGDARTHFSDAALYLVLKACPSMPTKAAQRKIETLEDFETRCGPYVVSLKKDDWSGGTRPEYDLVLMISVQP